MWAARSTPRVPRSASTIRVELLGRAYRLQGHLGGAPTRALRCAVHDAVWPSCSVARVSASRRASRSSGWQRSLTAVPGARTGARPSTRSAEAPARRRPQGQGQEPEAAGWEPRVSNGTSAAGFEESAQGAGECPGRKKRGVCELARCRRARFARTGPATPLCGLARRGLMPPLQRLQGEVQRTDDGDENDGEGAMRGLLLPAQRVVRPGPR